MYHFNCLRFRFFGFFLCGLSTVDYGLFPSLPTDTTSSCSQNQRTSLLFYAVYIHLTDSIYFLPFSVSRYFCNRLFGFSGMVYSMKFAASNSFTALFKEPVLLFNFNL